VGDLNITGGTVTAGGFLALLATQGDIHVDASSTLQFTGSNGAFTATATAGSLTFDADLNDAGGTAPLSITGMAGNGITIDGTLVSASANGAGTQTGTGITLTATGGDFTASSGSVIKSRGGDIDLAADSGTMTLGGNVNSAGAATLSSSGDLMLTGTLETVDDAALSSTGGALTLSGTITTSGDTANNIPGDVTLTSGGDLDLTGGTVNTAGSLTLMSTGGNINVDANSILNFIDSNGSFTATATTGTLTIDADVDVQGSYPLGITGTAGNGITIDGTLISASANNAGTQAGTGIMLMATGGNFLANAGSVIESGAGDITLAANNGTMMLEGDVNSAGAATLSSSGDLMLTGTLETIDDAMLTSNGGNLTLSGAITTTGDPTNSIPGDVTLTSASDLELTGTSSIFTAGSLTLNSTGGDINVDANSNLQFVDSNGSFTATASGSLTISANIDAEGASPLGITGTAGNGITINGTLISASTNNAGTQPGTGISLTAMGGDFMATSGSLIESAAGDITLAANNGMMTLGGNVSSAGAAMISSSGDMLLTGQVESVDDTTLMAGGGLTLNNGTITTLGDPDNDIPGDVTLSSGNDLDLTGATITTAGSLSLTSNNGNVNVDASSSFLFTNSNGTLSVNANGGDLTLNLTLGDGDGGSYPLGITGGALFDVDINGSLVTAAKSGDGTQLGSGIQLTSDFGNFSATAGSLIESLYGDITLAANYGALTLAGTVQSAGNLTLTSADLMMLTGGISAAGSVSATTTGNNADLITGTGMTDDTSSIQSGGQISLMSTGDMNLRDSIVSTGSFLQAAAGGTLDLAGSITTQTGLSLLATGGDLTVTGSATNAGNGVNGGDVSLTASQGSLTISGTVVNGDANAPSGTTAFAASGTFSTGVHATGTYPVQANVITINEPGQTFTPGNVQLDLTAFEPVDSDATSSLNVYGASITVLGGNTGFVSPYNTTTVTSTGPVTISNDAGLTSLSAGYGSTAGNLTLETDSTLTVAALQVGNNMLLDSGSAFLLQYAANPSNRIGNNLTTSGTVTITLQAPLFVVGAVGVNAATDTPAYILNGTDPVLTAQGSVNLGAGSVTGSAGSEIATNGSFQTTGNVTIQTLNAFNGITIGGNLTVETLGTRSLQGPQIDPEFPTYVTGTVTPFNVGGLNVFTLGEFGTAGGLQFDGNATVINASSLTLNVSGNLAFGPGATTPGTDPQSVNATNFAGSSNATAGGNGGILTVNTLAAGNDVGNILIRNTPNVGQGSPLLDASGGGYATPDSGSGTAGNGGELGLTAAGSITVQDAATLTVAGGDFTDSQNEGSIHTGPAVAGPATSAGSGGVIALKAGSTLTVGETADTVSLVADGGGFDTFYDTGTPGNGGTITLQAAQTVSIVDAYVSASGGESANSASGNGGAINVVSTGTSATGTSVSIMGASLLATTGLNYDVEYGGTGGTINIASNDATGTSAAAAILIDSSLLEASIDESNDSGGITSQNGGTINITSARTAGAGISVQDSSQLVATISSASAQNTPAPTGGTVNLTTSGASITVDSSTINASGPNSAINLNTGANGGTITVSGNSTLSTADADGAVSTGATVFLNAGSGSTALPSVINLTGATLTADVLKIQALGTNGQITIGGSSTLSGTTQLMLYAGDTSSHTTGLIDFTANTTLTLNGTVAGVLAANTITIASGVTVTVNGSTALSIYGNNRNYDSAGNNAGTPADFGSFGGSGAPTVASTHNFDSNTPAPTATQVAQAGHVVATWNVGGHRIIAISSSPVQKPATGSKTASGGKLGRMPASARPGGHRSTAKMVDPNKQIARRDVPDLSSSLRPALAVQR
jgi:filamentous hemagglutinin